MHIIHIVLCVIFMILLRDTSMFYYFYLYHSQSLIIYDTTAIVHLVHIRSSLFRILTVVVTIKCARNAHSNAQYIPVRGAVIPILF